MLQTGIYVRVSTEEQAQEGYSIRAQALNKVDLLVIPLDGSNNNVNSVFRGNSQFRHALDTIQQYKNGDFPFKLKVNTVMTSENYDDLINISRFLLDKRIYWRIFFCKEKGRENNIQKKHLLSKEAFVEKIKQLQSSNAMVNLSISDAQNELEYTILVPDGSIYIAKGEHDTLIGNINAFSERDIIYEINARKFSIDQHFSEIMPF